jgi:hypothetical protein
MHVGDRHLPLAVTADVRFLARLPIHSLGQNRPLVICSEFPRLARLG